jgi:RecB family exonuclease
LASVLELPLRLASTGRALAGFYAFDVSRLARAVAEPRLLRLGLRPWNSGLDALLATRLIETRPELRAPSAPSGPVAWVFARTLGELRRAGISPEDLGTAVQGLGATPEDEARLGLLVELYGEFHNALEGSFADPASILRAAKAHVGESLWVRGFEVMVVDSLELDPLEREFLAALAGVVPVRFVPEEIPPSLRGGSFTAWAVGHGLAPGTFQGTALEALAPPAPPEGIARLRTTLFEPPDLPPCRDDSVEFRTAPGEAAEAKAIVRRLLREATSGVPFEEMAVILPDAALYAPLFTDILERLRIPYRLHPSLPLKHGRAARALQLLFRCRGLERGPVMEFLTFAPTGYSELLGGTAPPAARWDALSRAARIVSGFERWRVGLDAFAAAELDAVHPSGSEAYRSARERNAGDARLLLQVVTALHETLDSLSGTRGWGEWADHLEDVVGRWAKGERDTETLLALVDDLRSLGAVPGEVAWSEVEDVILSRLEWERLPAERVTSGALHVGSLDAVSGLRFRVVAIPGLGEGIFPPVLRGDPLLDDRERGALRRGGSPTRQLSLFDSSPLPALPTTQDRLEEARRRFHRACAQATERLILSFPRADPRTGRERLPSVFFVAALSAEQGRPVSGADLQALVQEDDPWGAPLEEVLDRSERDLVRIRKSRDARHAIAAGSTFFRQSHLSSEARGRGRLSPFDGIVSDLPPDLKARLDLVGPRPVSASRLATFARCGFLYLVRHVLGIEPDPEPEERRRLDPLERGNLFHQVAEDFLRERRDRGELPLKETGALRERLREMGDAALDGLVAGSPPRFTLLWNRERARFLRSLDTWLAREVDRKGSTPAFFEVTFGPIPPSPGEPAFPEPLEISLGDGRVLLVQGRIDRIDRLEDGTLALRDYKTGKAPRDDSIFQGGKQLQMSFYVLAAAHNFPDTRVSKALLDYVDADRPLSFHTAVVTGQAFQDLLRGMVDAVSKGHFVQEPSSCDFCEYTAICGPRALIERRLDRKRGDAILKDLQRLRSVR